MGVRRRLIRELLSSLRYIKNLTEQQIKASLWRGEATLSDLELEPRKLQTLFHDSFPCGLEIRSATVKEVYVRIPWRQIMTHSVTIVARDVEVSVIVHCQDDEQWQQVVASLHRRYLRNVLERVENAPVSMAFGGTGSFEHIRQRMMDALQIQVDRATMVFVSGHPRHFPSHGELEGGHRELDEVLRVTGEDIVMSPSDSSRIPTDKLKHMATYIERDRVLRLTKVIKCRAFCVVPGRCPNGCPHAVREFMKPVALTLAIAQRYASDGTRICPFLVGNDLAFDFPGGLVFEACECQVRGFSAIVMDVGALEGWRLNAALLETDTEPLRDTSSIARTFARGAETGRQQGASDGDSAEARSSRGASAGASPETGARSPPASPQVSSASPSLGPASLPVGGLSLDGVEEEEEEEEDEREDEATLCEPSWDEGRAAKLQREDSDHSFTSTTGFTADEGDEGGAHSASQSPTDMTTGEPLLDLQNTSSSARTLAKGKDSPEHHSLSGTKLATGLWKKLKKTRIAMPSPHGLQSYFWDHSSPRDAHGHPGHEQHGHEQHGQEGHGPDHHGPHAAESSSHSHEPQVQDGHLQQGMSPGSGKGDEEGEDEESVAGEDEDVDFYDAEEYYSVASDEAASFAERAMESMSSQSSWIKPVLKWLGSKGNQSTPQHWPEIHSVAKEMSIGASHLTIRITVVDPGLEQPMVGELRLDDAAWCSHAELGLPVAQLECVHRLSNAAEERHGAVQRTIDDVGPWCLPTLLQSAQRMVWPRGELWLRTADCEACLLRGRGPTEVPGGDALLTFRWQPREAPPVELESDNQILSTWPLRIQLSGAALLADPARWAEAKRCHERCKPFLSSKRPPPTMLPAKEPETSDKVFPVESYFMEMVNCEFVEPLKESVMLAERRWPFHVVVPRLEMRSRSDFWDFAELVEGYAPTQEPASCDPGATRAPAPTSGAGGEADGGVTIPKEMFDHLVQRAAEATLKDSQVAAAREELQKAYITLATVRASAQNPAQADRGSSHAHHDPVERSAPTESQAVAGEVEELERLRRRCAQLESSLQSQGLAQRRLETELANFQALARDELRQTALCGFGSRRAGATVGPSAPT